MSALLNVQGTYRVVYPTAGIDVTVDGYTPNQIKEQFATLHKELERATVQVDGRTVTFTVPSGQKNSALLNVQGTYRVVYPTAGIDVTVDGYTPNQIKEQFATLHKELERATVQVDGRTVTFTVPSGQKNG